MRNESLDKITIDLPAIGSTLNNLGPITLNNKNKEIRSKGGENSSFDFLDATTGVSQGRNQKAKPYATSDSNKLDASTISNSKSIITASDKLK